MKIPRKEFLTDSLDPKFMEQLLVQAETVMRTWQTTWSPFTSAPLIEEALLKMKKISELECKAEGGHPCAERKRLECKRNHPQKNFSNEAIPIHGLIIQGNFLFDTPSPQDINQALQSLGIHSENLGDIWIKGNRGAEAICTPEASETLNGQIGQVRGIPITCKSVSIDQLQPPSPRIPKKVTSVEASKRLDAVASAGFGMSRSKIVSEIKNGRLRLNWQAVKQPCKELSVGDRLRLEDRGNLEVLSLEQTKRQRWRVEMLRS